jgi:hypothetical protein
MTPHDFVRALRRELAWLGGHFDPADVQRFVAAEWPRIQRDPDPVGWAWEFLDRGYPDPAA